jgi:hypothetical protein
VFFGRCSVVTTNKKQKKGRKNKQTNKQTQTTAHLSFTSLSRKPHILLSTNKMQRYTIFFITVNVLPVLGGFSAHHQELKSVHTASGLYQGLLK